MSYKQIKTLKKMEKYTKVQRFTIGLVKLVGIIAAAFTFVFAVGFAAHYFKLPTDFTTSTTHQIKWTPGTMNYDASGMIKSYTPGDQTLIIIEPSFTEKFFDTLASGLVTSMFLAILALVGTGFYFVIMSLGGKDEATETTEQKDSQNTKYIKEGYQPTDIIDTSNPPSGNPPSKNE